MTRKVFPKASICLSRGETAIQTTLHIDSIPISSHDIQIPSTVPMKYVIFLSTTLQNMQAPPPKLQAQHRRTEEGAWKCSPL
mmetsp:Transcript_10026/g.14898  ORF Transcript_10026/g.14898 Transcript_10026/m.14898 type:complete len:82 (-) Transcript_10026:99-344(-)